MIAFVSESERIVISISSGLTSLVSGAAPKLLRAYASISIGISRSPIVLEPWMPKRRTSPCGGGPPVSSFFDGGGQLQGSTLTLQTFAAGYSSGVVEPGT